MKIGFVLDDSLDSTDGVQQYILTLGRWLSNAGHEVHYLVGQTTRSDIPNIHSLCKNISVRFNGNRMSMPLPARKKHIQELLQKEQFDVLPVQMPYSPFMAAKVIKAAPKDTKIIGTFHILPYGNMQLIATKLLFWWLRSSLKRFDSILSVSQPAADFAQKFGIASEVVPNTVDLQHFVVQKPASTGTFKIIFLGRLVPRKGCMELLHAIRNIIESKRISNLEVIIGGKGPQMEHLQKYCSDHNLQKNVSFVGFVAEKDKPGFLASADIAVFPSISGESFGIVLIEAMASGAGVVLGGRNPGYASVLTSLPETLFNPNNPAELQTSIELIHNDPELAAKLHHQQQELVKQFDIRVVAKKLLSYYQA